MISRRFSRLTLIVLCSTLAITACKKKPPADSDAYNGGGDNGGAQTYGTADDMGLDGANGKRHVNALTAPANQVYYFDYDNSSVSQDDNHAISIQANYLVSHPDAHIRLEGNTDSRGSREYNIGLGYRRAQAVAQVLEQDGVSAKQISMVSYGKERPVAEGDDESAWSLNRRVELVYENK